jgi:acyl-CoA dehydrogenase
MLDISQSCQSSSREKASGWPADVWWREIRPYQTAPISTNPILAYIGQHVLGMPRSY